MPHPGHGKGHSLKGSSGRGSSSDSYMKGPSDDNGGEESSGITCQWCGAFMEEHGCQGWIDKVRIQLDSTGGPLCTAIGYKHSPDFGYNTWIVCPDCAKAILELKEKREKIKQPVIGEAEQENIVEKNVVKKPNCYKCKYRGMVPGSAHSRCKHPKVKIDDNPFTALGIEGHATGIGKGWFVWPANFDPVWLLACNGFEEKQSGVAG